MMHISITEYMPVELMAGETPTMPTQTTITTCGALPWRMEMSLEELLMVQIPQLEGRKEGGCSGGSSTIVECLISK